LLEMASMLSYSTHNSQSGGAGELGAGVFQGSVGNLSCTAPSYFEFLTTKGLLPSSTSNGCGAPRHYWRRQCITGLVDWKRFSKDCYDLPRRITGRASNNTFKTVPDCWAAKGKKFRR